jgi:hypothetical protein
MLWYSLTAGDGALIGHATREARPLPGGGREIVETQEIDLATEAGDRAAQTDETVTTEDANGRTLSIHDESHGNRLTFRTDIRIDGDRAEIIHVGPHVTRRFEVALPANVRFDGGEGLLAAWNPATEPTLAFDAFNVADLDVEHDTIEPDPAAGAGRHAIRKRYDGDQLLDIASLTLDDAGRVVAATQRTFGGSITERLSDPAAASAVHVPFAAVENEMVKSPDLIPDTALHSHIRYRFGVASGVAVRFPATGEQAVEASPGAAVLDICAACGQGLPTDAAYLAAARKPTLWLESDDPRILRLADPIVHEAGPDARKMEALAHLTDEMISQVDFTAHLSAVETLERGSGDCAGVAVLLAALGRAAGIPTKVVDGLIYSREQYHGASNIFMPHSWVLAYVDGRWRSFDAAVGGFDNTHIALVTGDGEPRDFAAASELASYLSWQGMSEVRTKPAS